MPIDPSSPVTITGNVALAPAASPAGPTPAHAGSISGNGSARGADAFARDGASLGGVANSDNGLPIRGGPPDRLAAAETAFEAARQRYTDARGRWRGTGLRFYDPTLPLAVPDEISRACAALLGATAELWRAHGIAFDFDRTVGALTVRPDAATPLGRYATALAAYGERAVFNPSLLYVQNAFGHHDTGNRMVFISLNAAAASAPGVTEGHELIHARLHHRFHVEERYHLLNAWLTPAPGGNLFGTGRSYTGGFSLEELATAAHDILADAGAERVRGLAVALDDPGSPTGSAATADARSVLASLDRYLTELNRPRLPEAVQTAAERFLASSASWAGEGWQRGASDYYDDFTNVDPSTGQYRKRQVLRQGESGSGVHVELTHYPLSGKDRRVIGALLVDHSRGVRLELPILDPAAVGQVTGSGGSAANAIDGAALANLVRRFLPVRLRALLTVAQAQQRAYAALETARLELRACLDTGRPAGAAARSLASALEALGAASGPDEDLEPQTPA